MTEYYTDGMAARSPEVCKLAVSTCSFTKPTSMVQGVEILTNVAPNTQAEILTEDALTFLAVLHRTFESTRQNLLVARDVAQRRYDSGVSFDFPAETSHIRADLTWHCAAPGPGLEDRRVEITGPTDRKMVINALNSGAKTFMADFEGKQYTRVWSTQQLMLA